MNLEELVGPEFDWNKDFPSQPVKNLLEPVGLFEDFVACCEELRQIRSRTSVVNVREFVLVRMFLAKHNPAPAPTDTEYADVLRRCRKHASLTIGTYEKDLDWAYANATCRPSEIRPFSCPSHTAVTLLVQARENPKMFVQQVMRAKQATIASQPDSKKAIAAPAAEPKKRVKNVDLSDAISNFGATG
jgi:hypothetical protein